MASIPACDFTGPVLDAASGVWRYTVTSPFQRGPNAIDVLLPGNFDRSRKYRVIYVLPVEPGIGGYYGNGLAEVRKSGLHNTCGFIAVQPAFDTEPWYADHDTDPVRWHESYIKHAVVPLIEKEYAPTSPHPPAPSPSVERGKSPLPDLRSASPSGGRGPKGREGRLLLGFSKSGWGAFTLLLRNPEFFGYAASWDAPLMLEECWWRMAEQFGSDESFQRHRPASLFQTQARHFRDRTRLVLLGESAFGESPGGKYAGTSHTRRAHKRMNDLGIRHAYADDLCTEHRWDSGWVRFAVNALMRLVNW